MRSKILPLLAAAVIAAVMTGCTDNHTNIPPDTDSRPAESTVRPSDSDNIQLKDYTAPAFLEDAPAADVLTDVVYRSFDPAAILTEPEKQPFDGYKCTGLFNDLCYVYKEGENYGLLSLDGEVLLPHDNIVRINAAGAGLLAVRYKDKTRAYFRVDEGGIYSEEIGKFNKDRITIDPAEPDGTDREHFIIRVDGEDIYPTEWLSIDPVSPGDIATEQRFEAVYLARNAAGRFYLAFDNLYNLTVFRAECGFVELKIGDLYGGFYITDPEKYSELETLVRSFGDEPDANKAVPAAEPSYDYVRIVFGRENAEDKSIFTISPEGYCFTERPPQPTAEADAGQGQVRFFRKLSPETFTDLVYWVDKYAPSAEKNER